jgi:nicotinate phosphoribosyltransferase
MELRQHCQEELDSLWEETRRFDNPHQVYVDLSDKLFKLRGELLEQMSMD